jgi:hypothetical protein
VNFQARDERQAKEAEERARREAYEQSAEGRLARLSPLARESYEEFRRLIATWDWDWLQATTRERGHFDLGDEAELRHYDPLEETPALAKGFEAALLEACSRFGLALREMGSTPREGRKYQVRPLEGDDHA